MTSSQIYKLFRPLPILFFFFTTFSFLWMIEFIHRKFWIIIIFTSEKSYLSFMASNMIHAIIRPSHGTFNMMIFIAHKCYNLRRINSDLTYTDALWRVWQGGTTEPENMILTLAPVREGAECRSEWRNSFNWAWLDSWWNFVKSLIAYLRWHYEVKGSHEGVFWDFLFLID